MAFDFHSPIDIGTTLYIVDKKSGEHRMCNVHRIMLVDRHVGIALDIEGNVICPISNFIDEGKGCYVGDNYVTTDSLDALHMVEKLKGDSIG